MEIVLIILGFILIVVFWDRFLAGLGAAIVFGIIGAFFGIAPIAAIIGFILAAIGHEKEEVENNSNSYGKEKIEEKLNDKTYKEDRFDKEKIDQKQKYENYSEKSRNNTRIISCPSCKQKIRIILPLSGNVGKCVKCKSPAIPAGV